uniref:DNA mismatch repair protein S5 domain-containing protein n=1 Tax=Arcella intermedia TaxID=1963864 RepID=A0A6B2KX73_9EUKA
MATAVKELVENAIDAKCSQVEVKLKNYGADGVEVTDNGTGIDPNNYSIIAQRYCTSKIDHFEELESLCSYGFRGEALNSLCSVAQVSITSRTKDQTTATSLLFDNEGHIMEQSQTAGRTGTTVNFREFFKSIPVRYQEFQRNIKKEFNKLQSTLQAYAIVRSEIRFVVVNTDKNGSQKQLLLTPGRGSLKDNIERIFGYKFAMNLEELDVRSDVACVTGYVSGIDKDSGRTLASHQYLYINKRPVDLSKILRVINKTYKQYNPKSAPILFLNIELPTDTIDVNIQPDKRLIFMAKEKEVVDFLLESLKSIWDPSLHRMDTQAPLMDEDEMLLTSTPKLPPSKKRKITSKNQSPFFQGENTKGKQKSEKEEDGNKDGEDSDVDPEFEQEATQSQPKKISKVQNIEIKSKISEPAKKEKSKSETKSLLHNTEQPKSKGIFFQTVQERLKKKKDYTKEILGEEYPESEEDIFEEFPTETIEAESDDDTAITLNFNLDKIVAYTKKLKLKNKATFSQGPKFVTVMGKSSTQDIESELNKKISKESFDEMKVIGQFNLGFIITKLNQNLFIIDQHASDEKFNFEDLKQNTQLQIQKLLSPLTLELSTSDEMIVMDNIDVFRKNGFELEIDEKAKLTQRIKLTTYPFSKGAQFGVTDIQELIFLLKESPAGSMVRLARVSKAFATRACHKSVTIGTPLNQDKMKKIIANMGTMENPWCCPHGRPTVRHLFDLESINQIVLKNKKAKSDKFKTKYAFLDDPEGDFEEQIPGIKPSLSKSKDFTPKFNLSSSQGKNSKTSPQPNLSSSKEKNTKIAQQPFFPITRTMDTSTSTAVLQQDLKIPTLQPKSKIEEQISLLDDSSSSELEDLINPFKVKDSAPHKQTSTPTHSQETASRTPNSQPFFATQSNPLKKPLKNTPQHTQRSTKLPWTFK